MSTADLLSPVERVYPSKAAEIIDAKELARRWHVPVSWIREYTRPDRTDDPLPHVRFGKYVRFEWGSPPLEQWLARRRTAA